MNAVLSRKCEATQPADKLFFLLGRHGEEDFVEVLLNAGNGYGLAALKLLRPMFERLVTMMHLIRNPQDVQPFVAYHHVHARADLLAQLEHLDGLTRFKAGVDPLALREDLGARLADWQGLLERQPIQARQILRKLLSGRLIFEPFEDATSRGYIIRGQATYGRLLSGGYSVVPPG